MTGLAIVGAAFGVGYAWANLGRRFHPIGIREIFWGGEPTIHSDGSYNDVLERPIAGLGYCLLYRAADGTVLHRQFFPTRKAAKAWRP